MEAQELNQIISAVESTIDKRVNGKIDRLDKKLDAHLEEITPLLNLIKGSIIIRKVVIWFTSLMVAIVAGWAALKGLLKN